MPRILMLKNDSKYFLYTQEKVLNEILSLKPI